MANGNQPGVVSAVQYLSLSDGYLMDMRISRPTNIQGPLPMMIFFSGSGGSRVTNYGRAEQAAAMGIIGVAASARGQGEGGINLNDPASYGATFWGHRDTVDILELPEIINILVPELQGLVDLSKVGYTGRSMGGRLALRARAWGGYVPQAGDTMVDKGWREVDQAFLTPAFVAVGNWAFDQFNSAVPDAYTTKDRFRQALVDGFWTNESALGSWTEANPSLGLIGNPGLRNILEGFLDPDNPAGLMANFGNHDNWKAEFLQYRGLALASSVPTYFDIAQLEAWLLGNQIKDFVDASAAPDVYLNYTSGGHKSTAFYSSEALKELRLGAAAKYHLLGDDSGRSVFSNGPVATWADIPRWRKEILPYTNADYANLTTVPTEVFASSYDQEDQIKVTQRYLKNAAAGDGELQANAPTTTQARTLTRNWNNPTAMADIRTLVQVGGNSFDQIIGGNRLAPAELNFRYTLPAAHAGVLLGAAKVSNLHLISSSADVQLGAQLWLTRGAETIFIASGAKSANSFPTGTRQGPFSIELERIGLKLMANDVLTLRLVPWDAKERPYDTGENGVFTRLPHFSDGDLTIETSANLALTARLDLPILLDDPGTLTQPPFTVVETESTPGLVTGGGLIGNA
jgi:hypothetical protein